MDKIQIINPANIPESFIDTVNTVVETTSTFNTIVSCMFFMFLVFSTALIYVKAPRNTEDKED